MGKRDDFPIYPPWIPEKNPNNIIQVSEEDKQRLISLLEDFGGQATFQALAEAAKEKFEWDQGYLFVVSTFLIDEGRARIVRIRRKNSKRGPSFTGLKLEVEE